MGKLNRGRFTISANIILTASLITRSLTFGYVMMSIYIKAGDDILDTNVIKMVNIEKVFGMPFGSTVQSIVFSLIGVFVLEFLNGVFGLLGAIGKRKQFLVVAVTMSCLMIAVYVIYIVLIALIYHETNDIYNTLLPYSEAYNFGSSSQMASAYRYTVFPSFLRKIGCGFSLKETSACYAAYKEQVRTYLQTYFGVIITCLLCHAVSIIAVEYTYRKLEFKEKRTILSSNKYYLLLTIRHGIGRNMICFVRDNWRKSKTIFFSVTIKIISMIVHIGLLGLGLTLCGDVFITNGSLKHIFNQIKFYQYYFYDILVGLAASSVVLGILGAASSVVSLVGTWRKSPSLLISSCLCSTAMLVPRLVVVIIWAVFIEEINDKMRYELKIQQNGYYQSGDSSFNTITIAWNTMLMTLDCCGVNSYYETASHSYGEKYCCVNAHESRLDPWRTSSSNLNYFGGCGGYKSDTCNKKILFKTRMYTGWFMAIVLLQIVLGITGIFLENKEYSVSFSSTNTDEGLSRCSRICISFLSIYHSVVSSVKSFFIRHYMRFSGIVVYFISVGVVVVSSLCLLAFAVNIRYDTVFGNDDIKGLLARINITGTNFSRAIESFSIVVTTLSLASIATVVYSIVILVPKTTKTVFVIVDLGLWIIMAISNVIEIGLWGKFLAEVNSSVSNQLALDFVFYTYSHNSGRSSYSQISLYWNTLFVKAKCCGLSNTASSFVGTPWYTSRSDTNQLIPVQCCTSQTEVYLYDSMYDTMCTNIPLSHHSKGCDTVIEDRIQNKYSITFLVLSALIFIAEVLCIIIIVMSLKKKKVTGEHIQLIDLHSKEVNTNHKIEEENKQEPDNYTETEVKTSKRSKSKTSTNRKSRKNKENDIKLEKEKTVEEAGVVNADQIHADREYTVKKKRLKDTVGDKTSSIDLTGNDGEDITKFQNKRHSVDIEGQSISSHSDKRQSVDIERQSISSNSGKRQSVDIERQSISSHSDKRQSVDIEKQSIDSPTDKIKATDQVKHTTETITSMNDTEVTEIDHWDKSSVPDPDVDET